MASPLTCITDLEWAILSEDAVCVGRRETLLPASTASTPQELTVHLRESEGLYWAIKRQSCANGACTATMRITAFASVSGAKQWG